MGLAQCEHQPIRDRAKSINFKTRSNEQYFFKKYIPFCLSNLYSMNTRCKGRIIIPKVFVTCFWKISHSWRSIEVTMHNLRICSSVNLYHTVFTDQIHSYHVCLTVCWQKNHENRSPVYQRWISLMKIWSLISERACQCAVNIVVNTRYHVAVNRRKMISSKSSQKL